VSAYLFTSERLGFREFEPNDGEVLYRLNSDPEVSRYTGDPPFADVGEARAFILGYELYRLHGYGRWAVIQRQDQAFLGWAGLNLIDDEVDLGYRFFRSFWGQGFATEAAHACIEYGFGKLNLSRIIARALPENVASLKVLEKVGLKFIGQGTCKGLDGARVYEILRG
jgi:RimJ/RimL family protein N-acetyltransferase